MVFYFKTFKNNFFKNTVCNLNYYQLSEKKVDSNKYIYSLLLVKQVDKAPIHRIDSADCLNLSIFLLLCILLHYLQAFHLILWLFIVCLHVWPRPNVGELQAG